MQFAFLIKINCVRIFCVTSYIHKVDCYVFSFLVELVFNCTLYIACNNFLYKYFKITNANVTLKFVIFRCYCHWCFSYWKTPFGIIFTKHNFNKNYLQQNCFELPIFFNCQYLWFQLSAKMLWIANATCSIIFNAKLALDNGHFLYIHVSRCDPYYLYFVVMRTYLIC